MKNDNTNKLKYIGAVLIATAGLGLQQAHATLSGGTPLPFDHVLTPAEELSFIQHTGAPNTKAELFATLEADGSTTGPFAQFFTKTVISPDHWIVTWNLTGIVAGFLTSALTQDGTSATGTQRYLLSSVIDHEGKSGSGTLQFTSPPGDISHVSFFGTPVPDGGTTAMLLGAALGALGMARRYLMR